MKKKKTNTLDSWIDQSEMQRLADALLPAEPELAGEPESGRSLAEDVSSIGLPKQGLDINQAAAYRAAPFPTAAEVSPSQSDPVPEKSEKVPSISYRPEPVAEPSPASGTAATEVKAESDEVDEGPVLRAARALAAVRLRAEESGFLKRRHLVPAAAVSQVTAIPPVIADGQVSKDDQSLAAGQAGESSGGSFEVPQGPLRTRLDAFASWAMGLAEASRLVIVDGQGYTLLHRDLDGGGSGDPAMVDSAMRLTSVLEQVQARTDFARDGALNLPLEEGGWLGVLRCESAGGRLCVAVVTPAPLQVEKSALMKGELVRTMEAGRGER
ncbi:MAG: hypothetical protein QM496_12390 [Verrucomicrobiota bacterium]